MFRNLNLVKANWSWKMYSYIDGNYTTYRVKGGPNWQYSTFDANIALLRFFFC